MNPTDAKKLTETHPVEPWKPGELLPRALAFFVITTAGCAADLVSKSLIFSRYYAQPLAPQDVHVWLIPQVLGIQTSTNQGALFGLGQGNSLLFAALSLIALLGIVVWLFVFRAARDRWMNVTLAAISGGILGNLYDRLGLWHGPDPAPHEQFAVRDWIHFRLSGVPFLDPWPNFNIADSLLVCGAIAMLIHMVWLAPGKDAVDVGPSDPK